MSKYMYEVYELHKDHIGWEPSLGVKFKGGIVTDIIGGIKDERLVIVGYEIVED